MLLDLSLSAGVIQNEDYYKLLDNTTFLKCVMFVYPGRAQKA